MTKTPEQLAEEYERFNWCVNGLKSAFLAGYEAAMQSTEWQMRVLNNLNELINEPNEVD